MPWDLFFIVLAAVIPTVLVLLLGHRVTAQGVRPTVILLLRQDLAVFHTENIILMNRINFLLS